MCLQFCILLLLDCNGNSVLKFLIHHFLVFVFLSILISVFPYLATIPELSEPVIAELL